MLFASTLVVLTGVFVYNEPPTAFLLLIPAAIIVFCLSLVIGHFISEPLRSLHKTMLAFTNGNTKIVFPARGQMYEADQLADSFMEIARMAQSKQSDLLLKERRQTAFISDVAHELRTPLTAIHGNAEMLLDPDLPPELHDKFCNIIINESERLGRLSNDLLTLQHIEDEAKPAELQRINLKHLAQEVIEALSPMLRERQTEIKITGESPDVLGNSDRLKQVISNLVENASRFTSPGGHVTIDLFGMKNNSIITVKDDGPGFGDIDTKLLFDRFWRADPSRNRDTGGAGLGLPIVKSIVEAHDGTVEAVNLPEGGACFIVAIPSVLG